MYMYFCSPLPALFADSYFYTGVEMGVRVIVLAKKNPQCPLPGFQHGPFDPEASAER